MADQINVSNQWKPPTDPIKTDDWQPPTKPIGYQEPAKPSIFDTIGSAASSTWNALTTPPKFITDAANWAANKIDNPAGEGGYLQGFGAGALQGASQLLSPLNVGLSALGMGEGALVGKIGAGAEDLIPSLLNIQKLRQAASAPVVAHGAYNLLRPGSTGMERLQAIPEVAGGTAGLLGGKFVRMPPEELAGVKEPLALPPSRFSGARPNNTEVQGPIVGGSRGLALNRPYLRDANNPYSIQKPSGGTLTSNDVGERTSIPPEIAAEYGIEPGQNKDIELPKDEKPEDIQFARTSSGGVQIGADIKSLGKVLGSSLYKGDITKITTKELLQNSVDAVRHLGENGKVDVTFVTGGEEPYVEVKDNGKGLTLKEIHSVFTDLGSSGKRSDTEAVGGFGLAKAAPLLGGEKVEVTTVTREKNGIYEHKFGGTPDELLNGVEIETRKIPLGESVETGTTVRTYVPENSSFYDAKNFIRGMASNSSGIKANITLRDAYITPEYTDPVVHPPLDLKGANIKSLEGKAANVEIIIPKGTNFGESVGVQYQVLNNGMWQHAGRHGWDKIPSIPEKVIVNIKSKVPEGDPDYPFTANREELRGSTEQLVNKYIEDTIVKPALNHRMGELQRLYDEMPIIPGTSISLYDSGGKYTESELSNLLHNNEFKSLAEVIHDAVKTTLGKLYAHEPDWIKSVEKIGILFNASDEGVTYGVNAPNPTTRKHAILINPFGIMAETNVAEEAASGIGHVILHEIAHEGAHSEDAKFTASLARVYRMIGRQHENEINLNIQRAIGDPDGGTGYHPELQELLQQYIESRGRTETTPDLLTGTASQSTDKRSKRTNKVSGNSQSNASGAIAKLVAAVREAAPIREEQEKMYSMERAKRFAKASAIVKNGKNPGFAGFYKQLNKLKGPLPRANYEGTSLTSAEGDSLVDAITASPYLMEGEKIRAKMGLLKLIGKGDVPQRSELNLLRQVFGKEFDPIVEMHGGLGGPVKRDIIIKTMNLPKAIMASIDLSAPLRQGLPLIHKQGWRDAWIPMVRAFASQEYYDDLQETIRNRPYYLLGKEAGLVLTDINDNLGNREEAFQSFKGGLMKAGVIQSERGYVAFLNKLRADTFDGLIDDAKALGLHPKDMMHKIAQFVNVSTGRGSLDMSGNKLVKLIGQDKTGFGNLDKIADELNTVFFSPRLIASRISMLNPARYVTGNPFVRKEAIKSALAMSSASALMLGLMAAMGAKIGHSLSDSKGTPVIPGTGHGFPMMPINADFGKAKFGNTRVETSGGFMPYIVAFGRFMAGETESSVTDKRSILSKGYNAETRRSIIGKFVENKLSPVASLLDVLMQGKDFNGNPTNVPYEVGQRFVPMFLKDLYEVTQDDPNHWPIAINSLLGNSVQTYQKPKPKNPFRISVH